MMKKVSVVINTLNEEKNLPRAIASVKELASEIVVVDMESEDKTVDIAKREGARVYSHKKTGYVEPARNFAIQKATSEWVLLLDADEEISQSLAKRITSAIKSEAYNYYALPRKNIIFGKWIKHSRWWPDYNIRLFKKGSVAWSDVIHSVPFTYGKGTDFEADEKNAIVHHHYDSVEQYIDRLNRYTTNQAKVVLDKGYRFKWSDLIKKPTAEFLSRYFQGEGYKDGIHGLVLAILQSFSEAVLIIKVWQNAKFKDENLPLNTVIKHIREAQKESNYWHADTLLKKEGGFAHRLKRKFKLP